jgi:LPXTG-motif cell wall-anchored protein
MSTYGYLISNQPAKATSGGGPIVLDGMDPACHAVYNEGTDRYIAKVLQSVYSQSTIAGNSSSIAVLGVGTSVGGCGSTWSAQMPSFLADFSTAPTVNFYNTAAEIDTFFDTTITSTPPTMIWIPDDWSRSSTINNKFTTNAEKIADFVNSGGGIFSSYNPYGWLTALLPNAVFNNGGCNGGPNATADGLADFGLTNADVTACWHGYFTGDIGTLKVLAEWGYPDANTSPMVAVSIGGGEVALPSSFTLAISPETPNAGEDLTITATAQTLAGVPQEGVVVTVTVSAGPDAGQTFTATTNSLGIAIITVRTNTEGTAVYTATATVNGVAKTVSATVSWNPPTTTTEPAPTTTEPAPTTTEPAPVITQPTEPEVVVPAEETTVPPKVNETTTTVHDHSTHSHGPLPKTGSSAYYTLIIGFGLICLGIGINQRKKYIR